MNDRKSTFLSACRERPLSVAIYLAALVLGFSFFPKVMIGFAIGFFFADYHQFIRSGKSVAGYCDEDYFQRKKP